MRPARAKGWPKDKDRNKQRPKRWSGAYRNRLQWGAPVSRLYFEWNYTLLMPCTGGRALSQVSGSGFPLGVVRDAKLRLRG